MTTRRQQPITQQHDADMIARGVISDPEQVAAKAQAESRACPHCGEMVHPTNWMSHLAREHADAPAKALHEMSPRLPIVVIRRDGGTQPREGINEATVKEYAEDLKDGAVFKPVTVFYDGQTYWLADGYHRIAAAEENGDLDFPVEVHQGTQRDAILFSVGANADHGLRRSNTDKRRAVNRLLNDAEWSKWSDREIAKHCRVGHQLVATLRKGLTGFSSSEKPLSRPTTGANGSQQPAEPPLQREVGKAKPMGGSPVTYTTKHGTTATMNTGKIAEANKSRAAERRIDVGDDYVPEVPEIDADEWEPTLVTPPHLTPVPSPNMEGREGDTLVLPRPLAELKVKMLDAPWDGKHFTAEIIGAPFKLRPGGVYRVAIYEVIGVADSPSVTTSPPNPLPMNGEGEVGSLLNRAPSPRVLGMPALTSVKVHMAGGD